MSILHSCHSCLRALVLGALTVAALAAVEGRAEDSLEQTRVKAAFVLNFMKFTAWPEQHATDSGTLTLCATEANPLDSQLHSLDGRDVRGLRVSVVHRPADEVPACDAVFVTRADAATLATLQHAAAGRPVLTISDQPGFIDRGGMIEMKLVAGRTRFDINLAAARAAGLTLSSQLLQLAERVVQ